MNAEQKQRAEQIVSQWGHTSAGTMGHAWAGRSAVALLQELIDAPEPEPFGYFRAEPFGWTDCSETDEGAIALYTAPPANNQSEQHLEMVNPPAPSVPDAALVRDAAPDIWRVMCGDWREETVAIHNSEGWIADGLDLKKAAALVEAHNGSLGLGVEAVERKLVTVSRGLYQFVDGVKIERIEQEQSK